MDKAKIGVNPKFFYMRIKANLKGTMLVRETNSI